MNARSLTGFVNGYRASNLASTEEEFDLLLPNLETKVDALLDSVRKSGDGEATQQLNDIVSIIHSAAPPKGRFKQFGSRFVEFVSRVKAKSTLPADQAWMQSSLEIARDVISVAEKSEDEEVVSIALRLGNLVKP
jgi:hypothetical protein